MQEFGVGLERFQVICTAPDATRFDRGSRVDSLRRSCGAPKGPPLVGFVGRLVPQSNSGLSGTGR